MMIDFAVPLNSTSVEFDDKKQLVFSAKD